MTEVAAGVTEALIEAIGNRLPELRLLTDTADRESYHPAAADAAWRIAFAFLVDTFMQGAAAAYA